MAINITDEEWDKLSSENFETAALEQVQETLSQLTELYPESLSYADLDDAD